MATKRLFAKFDLDMPDHPKVMPLSDAAFRAFVESVLWSRKQLTDGFLAKRYAVARWSLAVANELLASDDVAPLWIEVEGGYQIRDFDEHQETKAQIEHRSKQAVSAGRKGGLAKAKQSATKPLSKPLPETETETDIKLKQKFAAWWAAYPRKEDKLRAETAFSKALKKADAEELVKAAELYAAEKQGVDKKYIKLPATWLNAGSWMNEYAQQPQEQKPILTAEDIPSDW